MGVYFTAALTVGAEIAVIPTQTFVGVTKQATAECKSRGIELSGSCQFFGLLLAKIFRGQRHRQTVFIGTDGFIAQYARRWTV